MGLSADGQIHTRSTQIASVEPLSLPLSRSMRFRDTNLDVAGLVNPPLDYDGVLSNKAGEVIGLWSSYAVESERETTQENQGVPIDLVATMLDHIHSGMPLHSLETELTPLQLADARELGLSDEWLKKLEQHDPHRAPGADGSAHGGRFKRGHVVAAGRYPARDRWPDGHPFQRGRARGGRRSHGTGHGYGGLARQCN